MVPVSVLWIHETMTLAQEIYITVLINPNIKKLGWDKVGACFPFTSTITRN